MIAGTTIIITVKNFSMYGVYFTKIGGDNDTKPMPIEKDDNKEETDPVIIIKDGFDDELKENSIVDLIDGSKKLPKTATSYYTILLVGLLLTVIGGGVYYIIRKKRVV